MPRYELSEGTSNKFWQIELDGKSFTTTYGRIGSAGQTTVKKLATAAAAKAAYDKLVAEKTKKGYRLVGGKPAAPATPAANAPIPQRARDARLEALIEAAPDDPAAYLVYADWLEAQGDPRGQLIALQHNRKHAAANKLLEQHASHFYGDLAERRELLVPHEYAPLGRATAWRWGYLEAIWISNKHPGGGEPPTDNLPEVLGALLDHPSTRFVRELTVGIVALRTSNHYSDIAKVIGARRRPTLRKLTLGDFYSEETELNWSSIALDKRVYAAVPNLESLTLRSGRMSLAKMDLPRLRELVIISGGFDKASLRAICQSSLPALERLSIQLGREDKFTVKDLKPILDATAFPRLEHLGFSNSTITDAICAALATSKIAAQLEQLDLSLGTMGDEGAAALAAGSFPRLTTLDVDQNYLTTQGLRALKPLAKRDRIAGFRESNRNDGLQRDDGGNPEHRYIAAYE